MVGVAVMSTGEPDPTVIVVAGCEATAGESVDKIKEPFEAIYTPFVHAYIRIYLPYFN